MRLPTNLDMTRTRFALAAALCAPLAVLVACGDDASPGDGASGSAGSSTTSATDGSGSNTQGQTDSATSQGTMATAGNDGSESSSAGESTGTGEAMLSGTVTDLNAFFSGTTDVIEGAQISIFGLDAITATSGADGTFEIGPVPVGADYSFVVAPSTDYWGAIITMTIEDGSEAIELAQPPRELIEMFVVTLEEQGAEPVDETLAALAGRVISTSAVAEGSVTLDLDPAPDMNTYFTADTGGSMVLNSQEIVWDVIPVVAYYNLPESDPGTMELGATHPTRQCMPVHPAFPTLAEHITLVDIRCPPAG